MFLFSIIINPSKDLAEDFLLKKGSDKHMEICKYWKQRSLLVEPIKDDISNIYSDLWILPQMSQRFLKKLFNKC